MMLNQCTQESVACSIASLLRHSPCFQITPLEYFVDARNMGPISPQDTKWIVDALLPKLVAAHSTKGAFVIPVGAVGKIVVNN